MKILLLNPHLDTSHYIVQALRGQGVALLLPADSEEAWQVLHLHGKSVDLAIIHREGSSQEGADVGEILVARIKADRMQGDLPVILTSEQWSDETCAAHQESANGVNAYLRFPFPETALFHLIETVLERPLRADAVSSPVPSKPQPPKTQPLSQPKPQAQKSPPSPPPRSPSRSPSSAPPAPPAARAKEPVSDFSETILEESSSIYLRAPGGRTNPTIQFEAPDLGEGSEPQRAAPKSPEVIESFSESPEVIQSPEIIESNEVLVESEVVLQSDGDVTPSNEIIDDSPQLDMGDIIVEMSSESYTESESVSSIHIEAPGDLGDDILNVKLPDSLIPESVSSGSRSIVFESPVFQDPEPDPLGRSAHRSSVADPEISDSEIEQEMPYLFSGSNLGGELSRSFSESLGDAVVPGGAANSPDLETVKRYLLLREQDVVVLSSQLKAAKSQSVLLEKQLRDEKAAHANIVHVSDSQKRRIEDFQREQTTSEESLQTQIIDLNFQLKARTDKGRVLERQLRDSKEEMDQFKERVRADIRKIRVREKELENRLEILKKDSESLMSSRENKLIELKRKLDLMEFNMDLLQEQYAREKLESLRLREKLEKAAQVIKMAGGLLDPAKVDMTPGRDKESSE